MKNSYKEDYFKEDTDGLTEREFIGCVIIIILLLGGLGLFVYWVIKIVEFFLQAF